MSMRPLALAATLFVGASCSQVEIQTSADAVNTPVIPVRTATATRRSMPVEIQAIGNVEATTTIVVRSRVGGAIDKAHIRGGELVSAGALLFEIDPGPFKRAVALCRANLARDTALLEEAKAELERARAQAAYADQQLERAEQLAAEGVWSKDRVQQARSEAGARRSIVEAEAAAIESARAAVGASEAALSAAELELSYCHIHSPIAGRVGSLSLHPGNLVQAESDELVTIRQVAPVYVSFSVPESHLATLRRRLERGFGTVSALIEGDPEGPVTGSLSFLDNQVDAQTGTIRTRATFQNEDGRLWPGQFVDVSVTLEERPNEVAVPAGALQTGQTGPFLYVVREDDTVELRNVTTGATHDRLVAIRQGVAAGESVVTEGQLRVAPGMKVRAGS